MFKLSSDVLANFRGVQSALRELLDKIADIYRRLRSVEERIDGIPPGSSGTAYTSPLTTKGDLFIYDTGDQRLAVGNNGEIVVADSGETTGLHYRRESDPLYIVINQDHFLEGRPSGKSRTTYSGSGTAPSSEQFSDALGVWSVPGTATGLCRLFGCGANQTGDLGLNLSANELIVEGRVRFEDLSDATEDYTFSFGVMNDTTYSYNQHVLCRYTHSVNGGAFYLSTDNGSYSPTITNGTTTVAADTWYGIRLVITTSEAKLYTRTSGAWTLECSTSTEIPAATQELQVFVELLKNASAGGTRTAFIDYWRVSQLADR